MASTVGAVRRVPVRRSPDRWFHDTLGGQQRVRPGQLADGRSGGDVGGVARCRDLIQWSIRRPDEMHPPSGARGGTPPVAEPNWRGARRGHERWGVSGRNSAQSFDEMYACATNNSNGQRSVMLFGSVTGCWTAISRFAKHGALRGSMTVLTVSTLSRAGHTGQRCRARLRIGCPGGRLRAVEEIARWHRRAYHPSVAIAAQTHRRRVDLRSKVTGSWLTMVSRQPACGACTAAAEDTLTSRSWSRHSADDAPSTS